MAPLWVAFQANLGTLLRTCDAVGACIAVPDTPHYREALVKGDTLGRGRQPAVGHRADLLPAVCEVYLDAQNAGQLLASQERALHAAELLHRGLARVGVTALVDEATGYQEVRARHELQKILEAYVQAELRPWVRAFPDEFFREIYRLQDWEYRPGTSKRTPYVGKLVNKYIYEQLPHGVLEELRRVNPKNERGHRPRKHHQHLTADTGNTHLDRQISTVTTLMRISDNKHQFETLFERALPPVAPRLPLIIEAVDGIYPLPSHE